MTVTENPEDDFLSNARIAVLTNTLGPHSLPFCECISQSVPHFRVFTSGEADEFHGFPREWGSVKVTLLKSFNQLRVFRKAYGFWQTGELHIPYDTYSQLKRFRPDIILSNQLGIRTTLAVLYRNRHRGVKLILWATLSRHSESKRSWPRRALRKWLVRHVDAAFVNGRSSADYLRQLGYSGPVFTVPYTIHGALFESERYAPQPSSIRILYAGMLIPQKGLVPFTTALSRWCADHPGTTILFRLVGDGPEAAKIRRLPPNSNLTVEFLPKMPQDQLALQYGECDMFAFPTLGDEWGVVVNEAMIAGRPVLGSIYSQSATELVAEGKNGWLFDPLDAESIYSALQRAFTRSPGELQAMSADARETVRNITPDRVAATALLAMRELYQSRNSAL